MSPVNLTESNVNTNSANNSNGSVPSVVQGAKRRKPLKTNRVTQQPQLELDKEEQEEEVPPHVNHIEEVTEPVTPPGPIPEPIISPTTVVTSDGDNAYKCPLCKEDLKSQRDFTTHIRGHNEVKPHPDPNDPTGQAKVYYCCLCGKMLSSFSSLDRHMLVHSGERPFSCELCGQTFTTNGNMHRHKRTHSAKELQEYGAATGICISAGKRGGRKKKALSKEVEPVTEKKMKPNTPNQSSKQAEDDANPNLQNKCPNCELTFFSSATLESHLLSAHSGEELKCNQCNSSFVSVEMFRMHKLFHTTASTYSSPISSPSNLSIFSTSTAPRNPDFLHHEFPQLAKAFFSRDDNNFINNNVPSSVSSTFGKPESALVEQKTVVTANGQGPLSFGRHQALEGLDLKKNLDFDKSALPVNMESLNSINDKREHLDTNDDSNNKDLADVDSILSITKSSLRPQEMDHHSETSSSVDILGSHDDNDPIIKDMKLKGEFPCRLCPAVYPNLRALKGHNKEHLNKTPYLCNVGTCAYSSNDKSTLIRHMRTHTGEKPYECKLCNYGFTTKANCERHLKNKHEKRTRDQIKENLVIHETDDPPGEGGRIVPNAASLKKLQLEEQKEAGNFRCKVCKQLFATNVKVIAHAIKEHPAYSNDVDHIFEELKGRNSNSIAKNVLGDLNAPSMVPRMTNYPALKHLRPILPTVPVSQGLAVPSAVDQDEAPLDLSRRPNSSTENEEPSVTVTPVTKSLPKNDLAKSVGTMSFGLFPPFLFPNGNLKLPNLPAVDGASLGTPGTTLPFPLHPALMPAAFNLNMSEDFQVEFKKRILMQQQQQQQQQQVASALVAAAAGKMPPNLTASPSGQEKAASLQNDESQQTPPLTVTSSHNPLAFFAAESLRKQQELNEQKSGESISPHEKSKCSNEETTNGLKDQHYTDAMNGETGGENTQGSDSDSNYKMIIQNGVLMKKQKQRRYRTERPYTCHYCTAKFTLRSNMERHIKQQHPQNWSSKPRGSRRNHAATVPVLAPQFCNEEEQEFDEIKTPADKAKSEERKSEESAANSVHDGKSEEEVDDLASVPKLLQTNNTQRFFKELFGKSNDDNEVEEVSSDGETNSAEGSERKRSAYSAAPHRISCSYCPRKFPWISSLRRHVLTHTGDKPFRCHHCDLYFTTKSNCDRHMARKHSESHSASSEKAFTARNVKNRPHKCSKCPSSSFSSPDNLSEHQCSHHSTSRDAGESSGEEEGARSDRDQVYEFPKNVIFKCHLCEESFHEHSDAIGHLSIAHADDYDRLVDSGAFSEATKLPESPEEEDSDVRKVACLFCMKLLPDTSALSMHIKKHTSEEPQVCSESTGLEQDLIRHRKKHSSSALNHDSESDDSLVDLTHSEVKIMPQEASGEAEPKEEEEDCKKNNEEDKTARLKVETKKRKKPSLMDTVAKLKKGMA